MAKSFVQKIIKQYKDTGDVSALKRGGVSQSKVQDKNLLVLENIIKNNNDCTLKELCDLLTLETGIQVSISTMWRLCEKLNYTVKKNSVRHRKTDRKSTTKTM